MFGRLKFDLSDLANEMLDQLPVDLFVSETTTFLDPCMGGGQFVKAVEERLRSFGHNKDNIAKRVYGVENSRLRINYAINKHGLVGQYRYCEDYLEYDEKMKFDVVIGNPPYNEAAVSTKTIAGTSGNTTFYKKFIDMAFCIRKEDGVVLFVVQRNGIKYAAEKHNVSEYNNDTSMHWPFTAGYFVASKNNDQRFDITNDSILRKCYNLFSERPFSHAIGGNYSNLLNKGKVSLVKIPNSVYGLIECPKRGNSEIFGYIVGAHRPAGPKIVFKGLESKNSYIVTDCPAYVGSACVLYFDTIEDAEKARLFILHSPIIKYLQDKLKEKALGLIFRYIKNFDLTQIIEGNEIPVEFGLTQEEIDYIEATVK